MPTMSKTRSDLELDFFILEHNGHIVGFKLVARGETYSEMFCDSLRRNLVSGKATAKVSGDDIVLAIPSGREYSASLPTDVAERLKNLLDEDSRKNNLIVTADSFAITESCMVVLEDCRLTAKARLVE
jgi:hypothetical protein